MKQKITESTIQAINDLKQGYALGHADQRVKDANAALSEQRTPVALRWRLKANSQCPPSPWYYVDECGIDSFIERTSKQTDIEYQLLSVINPPQSQPNSAKEDKGLQVTTTGSYLLRCGLRADIYAILPHDETGDPYDQCARVKGNVYHFPNDKEKRKHLSFVETFDCWLANGHELAGCETPRDIVGPWPYPDNVILPPLRKTTATDSDD